MTIITDRGCHGSIPEAMEKLEEIKKLVAGIGGQVPDYIRVKGEPWHPVIEITGRHINIRLDVRFPAASPPEDTPQRAGQAGDTPE
jgi:hypothetical protein